MAATAKAPSGMPTARPIVVDDVGEVDCWLAVSDELHVAVTVAVKTAVVGVDVVEMVEEAAVAELMRADWAASARNGFPITTWKGTSSVQQKDGSSDEQVTKLQY